MICCLDAVCWVPTFSRFGGFPNFFNSFSSRMRYAIWRYAPRASIHLRRRRFHLRLRGSLFKVIRAGHSAARPL
jgi:hypothetical protein